MFILLMLLWAMQVYGSSQWIVDGDEGGEIYFVGFHPYLYGLSGFYYSDDYGETIEMRSINPPFGFGSLSTNRSSRNQYQCFF